MTKMKQPQANDRPGNSKRIGLALSGGGIRAVVFHLGVLKWLAEQALLEQIEHISSVSGGSLCIGLIYSANHYIWPKSDCFLTQILPQLRELILTRDIQAAGTRRLLREPWSLDRRVNLLAQVMQDRWGIRSSLEDLPKYPQWSINCTTFETGKDFRFSQSFMGDHKLGYVKDPDFPLAEAVAASAGFPVLIGPYRLNTKKYRWFEPRPASHPNAPGPSSISLCPKYDHIHLWDGGVYDNLGLEALYKVENCGHLTGSLNYLIISNASSLSGCKKRYPLLSTGNLRRLLDINRDQVSSLRSRDVLDYFHRSNKGFYVKIGTTAQRITEAAKEQLAPVGDLLGVTSLSHASGPAFHMPSISGGKPVPGQSRRSLINECLSSSSVAYAKNYPTALSSPTPHDFDLLLRHGYETAKCTAICFSLI